MLKSLCLTIGNPHHRTNWFDFSLERFNHQFLSTLQILTVREVCPLEAAERALLHPHCWSLGGAYTWQREKLRTCQLHLSHSKLCVVPSEGKKCDMVLLFLTALMGLLDIGEMWSSEGEDWGKMALCHFWRGGNTSAISLVELEIFSVGRAGPADGYSK